MSLTITETRNVVTVSPTTNTVTVTETPNTVEIATGLTIGHGIYTSLTDTHTRLADSGGTARITLGTANPHVLIGPSTPGTTVAVRINDQVRIGSTAAAGASVSRLQIGTWPSVSSGTPSLIGLDYSGVQGANLTRRHVITFAGTWDLVGFNLTNTLTGGFVCFRGNNAVIDSVGGGVLSLGTVFSAGQTYGSGGASITMTESALYFAEAYVDGSSGTNVITTHRAFWAENQGDVTIGTAIGVDIATQSGAATNIGLRLNANFTELSEMTAPAAGAANSCRLYVEDNGAGKTRLMALFSSGAAQQVAIQP